MDYEHLQQYQQSLLNRALTEGLKRNEEQTQTWSEYKTRHEKVIESLEAFSQELSVECMVPLGKKALMRGKLTHTNEILVSLGEGYFAKYSASQARALCDRRIKRADDILESLEKERNLYEMRQRIPECFDAFGGEQRKDLIEHWDEEKLGGWRVEHRQREKEYRKKLAESKKAEPPEIKTEDDLFAKLDALELQEELEDQLHRLEAKCPDFYNEDSDEDETFEEDSEETEDENEDIQSSEEKVDEPEIEFHPERSTIQRENFSGKSESDHIDDKIGESVPASPSKSSADLPTGEIAAATRGKRVAFGESQVKYIDEDSRTDSMNKALETPKTSSDEDSDDDDIVRIEFKHSDNSPEIPENKDEKTYTSPRDIYRIAMKPKSILKNSGKSPVRDVGVLATIDDVTDEETEESPVGISAYNTVVKDIQENITDKPTVEAVEKTEEKRPISKFRRDRANMKR